MQNFQPHCKAARYTIRQAAGAFASAVLLAACATQPNAPARGQEQDGSTPAVLGSTPVARPPQNSAIKAPVANQPALTLPALGWQAIALNALPNWQGDTLLDAWPAMQRSCQKLGARSNWNAFCAAALSGTPPSNDAARTLLSQYLTAYAQSDEPSKTTGIATAYFEPVYTANLSRTGAYQWPLYAAPEPMTSLPRAQLTPSAGGVHSSLVGKELAWFDNPIDPFLAQVQGSLRIQLPDGSVKRLGFAAKNGQPYQSIANTLIRQGVFTANQASMELIKSWSVGKDAATVQAVINTNPSFVFFKWLDIPAELGPVGAYNVPLSPMRSVAVDTAYTPLGVPLWLETTTANGAMQQLMLAQDVGSAIKGAARVDIYAGTGEAAGRLASAQKYPSKVWVLWPKP
jgi:membrane-bound lytic murein transglycosylase A